MKGQNLVTPEDAGKRVSFQFESPNGYLGEVVGLFEFYDHEAATYLVRRKDGTVARVPARDVRFGKVIRALSASPALLDELRALAVPLARRAAETAGRTPGPSEVSEKSAAGNLVTEIDRAAELAIVDGILAERPDDAILGEEGTDRNGTTSVRWVIDPLDGTASYVRGYPGYAVSIGIEVADHPSVGVVVGLDRLTVAVTGQGAEPRRRARPSGRTSIHDSVLATGFGYDPAMRVREARTLVEVIGRVADVRRSGSAAMDLCAVACGEVDAYFGSIVARGTRPRGAWPWSGRRRVPRGRASRRRGVDGRRADAAAQPLLGLLGDAGLETG